MASEYPQTLWGLDNRPPKDLSCRVDGGAGDRMAACRWAGMVDGKRGVLHRYVMERMGRAEGREGVPLFPSWKALVLRARAEKSATLTLVLDRLAATTFREARERNWCAD